MYGSYSASKKGQIEADKRKIKLANESLIEAHHAQTGLLSQEARGEKVEVSMLLIHAQDHLMNAITFRDLAQEMIELYERIKGVTSNFDVINKSKGSVCECSVFRRKVCTGSLLG